MLVNKGPVEWMSSDFYGNMQTHSASVFPVHHGVEGPLAEKHWDDAMQPWFWTTMPEVSMSLPRSTPCWPSRRNPCSSRRPHPRTVDKGLDEVSRRARIGPMFLGPTPPAEPWPAGAYDAYLQWLLDHPSLLLGGFPKRTYRLLGEAFKLTSSMGMSSGLLLPSTAPTPCWPSGKTQAEGRRQVRKMARSITGTAGARTVDEQPREEAEMVGRRCHATSRQNDARFGQITTLQPRLSEHQIDAGQPHRDRFSRHGLVG